jgi:hypothetical protein
VDTEPLEATAWTLLIIAVMFTVGFGLLAVVDIIRAPRGRRGLRLTPREKGTLLAMAGVTLPAAVTEILMHSFSPYVLLAIFAPLAIAVVYFSRRITRA